MLDYSILFDHFDAITDAPDGVKRLRSLVLRLALEGRLVRQDSSDEPVAGLLKRIDEERKRIASENRFRLHQQAGISAKDSLPWAVPEGWKWVRLGQLAFPQAGFAFKSSHFNTVGQGLPLIRIRDIGFEVTECWYEGEFRSEFLVNSGDYLVGMDGNFNVRQWRGPTALLNQRVTRLVFFGDELEQPFIAWALQNRINALQGQRAYTTVQHLSGKQIAASLIPIPPLPEQHRIVEKVDQLMDLCDEVEGCQERYRKVAQDCLDYLEVGGN